MRTKLPNAASLKPSAYLILMSPPTDTHRNFNIKETNTEIVGAQRTETAFTVNNIDVCMVRLLDRLFSHALQINYIYWKQIVLIQLTACFRVINIKI